MTTTSAVSLAFAMFHWAQGKPKKVAGTATEGDRTRRSPLREPHQRRRSRRLRLHVCFGVSAYCREFPFAQRPVSAYESRVELPRDLPDDATALEHRHHFGVLTWIEVWPYHR